MNPTTSTTSDTKSYSLPQVTCNQCNKLLGLIRRCGGCQAALYCDTACQTKHWSAHKSVCSLRTLANAVVTELQIGDHTVICYHPKKAFDGAKLLFFSLMLGHLFTRVKKVALAVISHPDSIKTTSVCIQPISFIEKIYEEFRSQLNHHDQLVLTSFKQKSGLDGPELLEALQDSFQILNAFAQDPTTLTLTTFSDQDDDNTIDGRRKDIAEGAYIRIYPHIKMTCLSISTYPKDFAVKNLLLDKPLPPAIQMSCVQYALTACEKNIEAEQFLRSSDEFDNFSWWFKRGYKAVKQPLERDVAVYFFEGTRVIEHVGSVVSQHLIQSKPGINHPYVYLHSWGTFIGNYGNRIAFLRREQKAEHAP